MSCKPVSGRKTLLRNTKQVVPQRTKIYNNASHRYEIVAKGTLNKCSASGKTTTASTKSLAVSDVNLSTPTPNTSNEIQNDIAKFKIETAQSLSPKYAAIDATRQMNFPPNKPVFKNLIPLSINPIEKVSEKKNQKPSARAPQMKDKTNIQLGRTPAPCINSVEFFYNKPPTAQRPNMLNDYNGLKPHHANATKYNVDEPKWNA